MMKEEFSKGIFWFVCSFDETDRCDFSETEMIAFPVPCDRNGKVTGYGNFNSRRGNAQNHKATWQTLVKGRRDLRKYGWNYFPRGRVEIAGGRAFIYLNINIICYEGFQRDIVERFHLKGLDIRVIGDNSAHYHCHGDDSGI